MKPKYLTIFCLLLLFPLKTFCQQILWSETFDIPEKGYWGNGSGGLNSDMSGISKWTINASSCAPVDAADYIKTVSTSGGRMQAVDINGEAIWASDIINISTCKNVAISVDVSETGSSTSTSKYVKVYYKLNGGAETLFATNGNNVGNFGSTTASQTKLNGTNLQIIVKVSNPNAGDACIFDDINVSYDNIKPSIQNIIALKSNQLRINFSEPVDKLSSETLANYSIAGFGNPTVAVLRTNNSTIDLTFPTDFSENSVYSVSASKVSDLSENVIDSISITFTYKAFKLNDVFVTGQNQTLLVFSHPLDKTSAETISKYIVDNGIGNPSAAILKSDTSVLLNLSGNFIDDQNYQINVDNISDIYGTALIGSSAKFTYHLTKTFDLIFNELMIDVNPLPNVLPAAKYIELFNRSNYNIYLSGWNLQIGHNSAIGLPEITIPSKGYMIICSSAQTNNFNQFGKAVGILSESQLATSGNSILLSNEQGILIDYVKYSDTWYGNPEKSNGGWSLERVDTGNFCGDSQNWKASTDFKGGTPGTINSVNNLNPDISKPKLLNVKILSSYKIGLQFSKNITQETGLTPTNFQLANGSITPTIINFSDTSRSTIILQFADQFIDGQEQTIQIKNITDFCGNIIEPASSKFTYVLIRPLSAFAENNKMVHLIFSEEVEVVSAQMSSNYSLDHELGKPISAIKHSSRKNEVYLEFSGNMENRQNYIIHIELVKDINGNLIKPADLAFVFFEPSPNDLIINEILFNPRPSGTDFVEIYNKSGFPVDLSKLKLASRDDMGKLESICSLSPNNSLYQTGHFLSITTDTTMVKNEYPAINYDKFLQSSSMPSFNDDKGTVVLLFGDTVLDEFAYNENMHFKLITNPEAVSLERIDPDKETQSTSNWHSTAESSGFATPANQNSQFRNLSDDISNEILIEPETFSPNGDGHDDFVFIRYKFGEPGYVANVSIYDSKGRIVKRIASGELLGIQGEFLWDGLNENGTKANIGIYVIYFEIFNLQGTVKKFKKVCVVADKLK